MNKYNLKAGLRYTKTNRILHIVFGRYHIKISRGSFIIENLKTFNTTWLWGWK